MWFRNRASAPRCGRSSGNFVRVCIDPRLPRCKHCQSLLCLAGIGGTDSTLFAGKPCTSGDIPRICCRPPDTYNAFLLLDTVLSFLQLSFASFSCMMHVDVASSSLCAHPQRAFVVHVCEYYEAHALNKQTCACYIFRGSMNGTDVCLYAMRLLLFHECSRLHAPRSWLRASAHRLLSATLKEEERNAKNN